MRQGPVLSRFILLYVVTGVASSDVQVSSRLEQEVLEVTCRLRGDLNGTLTQVNWVLNHGPSNQSSLGVYHPDHGAYVDPKYRDRVEVLGNEADCSSTLKLQGGASEQKGVVCCVFNAFPVGVLKGCVDMSAVVAAQEADDFEEAKIRKMEQWGLLIGGSLVCFLSITISIYLLCKNCYRHCCRRKRVFAVHTCLNNLQANSEDVLEESPPGSLPPSSLPPVPSQARGFDPSKLYSKIKLDLLYGRLWRSYQGTSRARTTGPPDPPGPQQPPSPSQAHPKGVYSLLAKPQPLTQEEVTHPSPEERSDVTLDPTTPEEGQGSEVTASSSAEHPEERNADDVTMS